MLDKCPKNYGCSQFGISDLYEVSQRSKMDIGDYGFEHSYMYKSGHVCGEGVITGYFIPLEYIKAAIDRSVSGWNCSESGCSCWRSSYFEQLKKCRSLEAKISKLEAQLAKLKPKKGRSK